MAGKGNPKTGGRKKGVANRTTRQFREIVDSTLFDDEAVTKERLLALRDSSDAVDRKTYWAIAMKRLPSTIEADVKTENTVKIIDLTAV